MEHLPLRRVAQGTMGVTSAMVQTLRELMAAELVAITFYASAASGRGVTENDADFFREHSEEEQGHYNNLADRLTEIQGQAIYTLDEARQLAPRDIEITNSMKAPELLELARVSSELETLAIQNYKAAIQQARQEEDETTIKVLRSILADEEEHLADFQAILEKANPVIIPPNLGQVGV